MSSDRKQNDGGPAFPAPEGDAMSHKVGDEWETTPGAPASRGMTLRDYFAALALSGMHARDSYDEGQSTPERRASLAYIEADAMLKAREAKND